MKREKFDQLYQDYYRLVLHVAYDIVQDYGGAQDVCQELFIKLDEKIESLDEEPIKGWILRNTYRIRAPCISWSNTGFPMQMRSSSLIW